MVDFKELSDAFDIVAARSEQISKPYQNRRCPSPCYRTGRNHALQGSLSLSWRRPRRGRRGWRGQSAVNSYRTKLDIFLQGIRRGKRQRIQSPSPTPVDAPPHAQSHHTHQVHYHGLLDRNRKYKGKHRDSDGCACKACATGKSVAHVRSEKATYNASAPCQLITFNFIGTANPKALGGYSWARTLAGARTKQGTLPFQEHERRHRLSPAVQPGFRTPSGSGIHRVCAGRERPYTVNKLQNYCLQTGS